MAEPKTARIGFISTRLAGTDGVSLEVTKWVEVLNRLGHECFFFAGELDWPAERSYLVPEAHFTHPDIETLNHDLFDDYTRSTETSRRVQVLKDHLKGHLYVFIRQFNLDLLITQNALSLPMNVPLGLAITEVIAETNIPTIGHHHDFGWERTRFAVNAAADYLQAAFPPTLPNLHHVVINSFAAHELARRTGASSMLVPNVMQFEVEAPPGDDYTATLRQDLGVKSNELLLVQPTRVVPRKRIELAIELACRLHRPCTLLISHASGDEGDAYAAYLRGYATLMGVRVLFGSDITSHSRGTTSDGRRIYSLADVYQQCDLVTYPSAIEGFGNAFLEAIYYRRPIVMSAYQIYKVDIQPKGFKVIHFDEFITEDTVHETKALLADPGRITEIVAHNYAIARRFYSYRALETRLVALLNASLGT